MTQHIANPARCTTATLTAADGATIAYLTLGTGPAVLVIPGALSTAADYLTFAEGLAERFTVHIIERRGRGQSSPQGADYSLATECADARLVQQATGAALLVGHSFGGLVALEVARNKPAFAKVAVYEPGVSISGSIPMGWMPAYERYLAAQKPLDAFVAFTLGIGPDRMRKTSPLLMKLMLPLFLKADARSRMFALLPQNLREHREVARFDSSYANYREIPADTLLMYGGKNQAAWAPLAIQQLSAVIPQATTREFPSFDHFGIDKEGAPEVAKVVSDFFSR